MGAPGSGKTTVSIIRLVMMAGSSLGCPQFINLASGSNLRVGMNSSAEVQLSDEFVLEGRTVTLIDIPGFNDTANGDAEILETIANLLATA